MKVFLFSDGLRKWFCVMGGVVIVLAGGAFCFLGMTGKFGVWKKAISERNKGKEKLEESGRVVRNRVVMPGTQGGNEVLRNGESKKDLNAKETMKQRSVVGEVLDVGAERVEDRLHRVRALRGSVLSDEDRARVMGFLSGRGAEKNGGGDGGSDRWAGLDAESARWMADELLTVLRLQEPKWESLPEELEKAAFCEGADEVMRDYVMQHLGHFWEQYGASEGIERALWRGVKESGRNKNGDEGDGMVAGSALIALSSGYERDGRAEDMGKVRERALALARDEGCDLGTRVTALSIAGEGGSKEVREFAKGLASDEKAPVMLRRVAGYVGGRD